VSYFARSLVSGSGFPPLAIKSRNSSKYLSPGGGYFCEAVQASANSTICWHADCLVAGMADENYLLLLLQVVCLLMFSYSMVLLTQHPEWFGA